MRRQVLLGGAALALWLISNPVPAQAHHDPLSAADEEAVREVTDVPPKRVELYAKFISARVAKLDLLARSPGKGDNAQQIHDTLEDYTSLVDEFQTNFEEYESWETNSRFPVPDLRKTLEKLKPDIDHWVATVSALPPNESYDFVKEAAVDANDSLKQGYADFVKRQADWFKQKHDKPAEDPNLRSPNIR